MSRESANYDPFLEPLRRMAPEVSYFGPQIESFSGIITNQLFGTDPNAPISRQAQPQLIGRASLSDVLNDVRHHPGALGILPYENSQTRPVDEAIDALFSGDFRVLYEAQLRLDIAVAGLGDSIEDVTEVYSYEKAVSQSQGFIKDNGLAAITIPGSTVSAAERVRSLGHKNHAALCSVAAAKRYGLNIFKHPVQDDTQHNRTRFLVIQHAEAGEPDISVLRSDLFTRRKSPKRAKIMGIVSPIKPASQNGLWKAIDFMDTWELTVGVPTGTRNNATSEDFDHQDHLMEFEGRPKKLVEAFQSPDVYRHMMTFKPLGIFAVARTYRERA